ncbi:hypothetical protein [Kitasatospora cheerisanensis]|uniref:hypothetical protein n=1 Tax=Kitasatospora cheerisanensis TaxID=81942 RepID=UPI000A5DBFF9|nr:hypothetical protein [Kitasatospora cheerisanensis]
MESVVEENRDRRIFRISGGAAEPDTGPEGSSGTSPAESEQAVPPENDGAGETP